MKLILAALTPDNRAVCQVALRTGLRVSDILELRADQLARCFWVTERKTGKRRQVGLPDWLIADILSRSGDSVWAFPGRDPARHRTRQAVWKDLKRVARAFRIPVNVGTHSMRKNFAVDLMHKYGDIAKVQRALNHDNSAVTMLYALADKLTESAPQRRNVKRRKR